MTGILGSQRRALETAGLSRSSWHYRVKPRARVARAKPQRERAYRARISFDERMEIEERIQAAWQAGHSVDHAFATAWDEGVMVASRRSWWRVASTMADQSTRPVAPTRRQARAPREAPVHCATAPDQVWSWDITDLRSPWRGVTFKAYSIIDIYSRKIVGWRVEDREADHLAVDMFAHAIATHRAPDYVHADSGPAMRSTLLASFLHSNHVTLTHNRPRVSNDNPYSESEFRTMKYRPNYPGTFPTVEDARAYMNWYVPWYNSRHKHSGIALFSPNEVHDGTWHERWASREATLGAYWHAHPERFRHRPHTPAPALLVGINFPEAASPRERLHAA